MEDSTNRKENQMNIAVIAANGRTGREFVNEALEKGHTVKAGVFGNHDFTENPSLTIVQCDATNIVQLEGLLSGAEAVASFIGHGKNSPATVQADAMKSTIEICKKLGLRRLISMTGTGVRYPADKITLIDRILNMSITVIDPKRVADGKLHADILRQSNLDFTIIRVLKLTNGDAKPYNLTASGPVKTLTSRKEVAKACLEVIENNSFIRQAPIISRAN